MNAYDLLTMQAFNEALGTRRALEAASIEEGILDAFDDPLAWRPDAGQMEWFRTQADRLARAKRGRAP